MNLFSATVAEDKSTSDVWLIQLNLELAVLLFEEAVLD